MLLAEDDPEMRALLAHTLEASGVEVETACDGHELRARLDAMGHDDTPDVVVSDVRMPGWTGLAALRWLRGNMPEIPVVIITAFGDPRTHERARELGAVAVFDKPFDLTVLTRAVIELLDSVEDCSARLRRA